MGHSSGVDTELIALKLQNLASEQLSYHLIQNNGQRIFKVKDDPDIPPPPKGTEVFVGRLPRECTEVELVPVLQTVGPIYKLRLMVDFSGRNKGYAFATYFTAENAMAAVERLNDYEIRKHCRIGVYKSVDNRRLFVGNIPVEKGKEEVVRELEPYTEGLKKVILYRSCENPSLNRGFAFLEFEDHRFAAMTRRKLSPGSLYLWGQSIVVDWAEPLPDVPPCIMSTVKKLYIRNLDLNMTTEELYTRLKNIIPRHATISKVHKSLDYAFVHFDTRTGAEKALNAIQENFCALGEEVEITWARPKMYSKENKVSQVPQNFCTSLPPHSRRLVQERQQLARMYMDNRYNQQPLAEHNKQYSQEHLTSTFIRNCNNVPFVPISKPGFY